MKAVLAAFAGALVLAGGALGASGPPSSTPSPSQSPFPIQSGLPFHASGSVIGEGTPLKAYANIVPTVHLFGDTLQAKLAVVADTRWVDPARLRVTAGFAPYTTVAAPTVLRIHVGRFEQLTWTWELRCLTAKCVPVSPPSETLHVFRFPSAHIEYLKANGAKDFGIDATWPAVEVLSQVSPGVESALLDNRRYDWQYSLTPVVAPTFRMSPMLLFWLALGLAGAAALGSLYAGARWYRVLRPRAAAVDAGPRPALDRALALLAWAHEHGDETLQRKAFERVASELGVVPAVDELSQAARELAWSPDVPEDEEVEAFTEEAREKGRGA
ncbi:MAG: hypothetical protein KGI93_02980 [Acidobacteriota bacterium]|nr:hypothetical protein [Acidobacteriota bacterium]MDE3191132.1 hypothetical protein [Acidobacteriota bacterium]